MVGGIYSGSLAIITDAAHLLSDVSGFAVAALAAHWARRAASAPFTWGYHRVEVLGALVSVMAVWVVTAMLLLEAVQRVIRPEPVDGKGACALGGAELPGREQAAAGCWRQARRPPCA